MSQGSSPEGVGACTRCGEFYPVFEHEGELMPVGRNGLCDCGNGALKPVSDTMLGNDEGGKTSPVL
jgi:hypothetical protein